MAATASRATLFARWPLASLSKYWNFAASSLSIAAAHTASEAAITSSSDRPTAAVVPAREGLAFALSSR